MQIAEVQEAKFRPNHPLPEGTRQFTCICDEQEFTPVIRNIGGDWTLQVVVEGEQKFAFAKSGDGTDGWIERWRPRHIPRRLRVTGPTLALDPRAAVDALRSELCKGDQPMPPAVLQTFAPCTVERKEHERGSYTSFKFRGATRQVRSLSKADWPLFSYSNSQGVYLLFIKPDGVFLLEAVMRFGRGNGMRRWQAEGAGDAAAPHHTIRALLAERFYDPELFHRMDKLNGFSNAPPRVSSEDPASDASAEIFEWPRGPIFKAEVKVETPEAPRPPS